MRSPTAHHQAKTHLLISVAWALLLIPTLLWWKNSILWVAAMSLYANFIGHLSAYQAAKAEHVTKQGFKGETGD